MDKVRYDVTYESLFRILVVIAVVWAILKLSSLIVYLLFSILLAVALHPLVKWIEKKGLKRSFALAVVLMLIIGVIILALVVMVGSLARNLILVWNTLPSHLDQFKGDPTIAPYVEQVKVTITNLDISQIVEVGVVKGSSILSSAASILNGIILVFFLTVFLSLEHKYLLNIVRKSLPKDWQSRYNEIVPVASKVIGGYIRGQALTSFLMMIAAFIIYTIIGIPNAFALAVFAGLTDIIPMVGGFIGVVPAAVVGLSVSPLTAILVVILMSAYQTLNNNYITPKVYGGSMKLSPFLVMITTTGGFMLFGMPGILLSLPIAAVASFAITEYFNIPILEKSKKSK